MKIDESVYLLIQNQLMARDFKKLFVIQYDPIDELREFCVTPESFETIIGLIGADKKLLSQCLNKFKAGYSESRIYMFLYSLGDNDHATSKTE